YRYLLFMAFRAFSREYGIGYFSKWFGAPLSFNQASSWSWIDRPGSGMRSEPKDPPTIWELTVSSSISHPDGFFFNLMVQHSTASTSCKKLALPQNVFHGSLSWSYGFSSFEGLSYSGIPRSRLLFNYRSISSLTTSFLISGRKVVCRGALRRKEYQKDMCTHSVA
ncbi:hypothetical protein Tco_0871658, partial [Tanacetum coccineum]